MRADERRPDELRMVTIKRNYLRFAEGSALIEAGNTRIICTATVEEGVPPFLERTGRGWVTAEYSMLPRSVEKRVKRESVTGKVGGRTHEIQRLIGRSLRAVCDLGRIGERTVFIDCDVLQADGGTRTVSITGAFIALCDALDTLVSKGVVEENPVIDSVAAVSVGMVGGIALLDLTYKEDSAAEVDMNVVMTGSGKLVEVQGTAESTPFTKEDLDRMISLASKGIKELSMVQQSALEG